jgi:hypothetical protein
MTKKYQILIRFLAPIQERKIKELMKLNKWVSINALMREALDEKYNKEVVECG